MNRRERRRLEKQFGMLEQYRNASKEEKSAIRARRREMGKKLHEQHLEKVENSLREQSEAREARIVQSWVEKGVSEEEARARINENMRIRQEREAKLEARRKRQAERNLLKK